MNLQEKILYCRKKEGLSQEALAEKVGVSRQSVSKWETGEATPEVGKLATLAKVFNVTVDWLLSDEPDQNANRDYDRDSDYRGMNTIDARYVDGKLRGIKGFIQKHSWLAGLYIAFSGLMITIVGSVFRYLALNMIGGFNKTSSDMMDPFNSFGNFGGGGTSSMSNMLDDTTSMMESMIGGFSMVMIVIGVLLMVFGLGLAAYLKIKANKDKQNNIYNM